MEIHWILYVIAPLQCWKEASIRKRYFFLLFLGNMPFFDWLHSSWEWRLPLPSPLNSLAFCQVPWAYDGLSDFTDSQRGTFETTIYLWKWEKSSKMAVFSEEAAGRQKLTLIPKMDSVIWYNGFGSTILWDQWSHVTVLPRHLLKS